MKRAAKARRAAAAAAIAILGYTSWAALRAPGQAASASSCGVGAWSSGAPVPSPRVAASLLVLDDGRVLRAGGHGTDEEDSTKVEVYDPARDTWRSLPSMQRGRTSPTLVQARDGRVLAIGGGEDWQSDYAFEVLDAALSSWRTVESPLATRVATAGRKADGTIVLAGGRPSADALAPCCATAERSSSATMGEWIFTAPHHADVRASPWNEHRGSFAVDSAHQVLSSGLSSSVNTGEHDANADKDRFRRGDRALGSSGPLRLGRHVTPGRHGHEHQQRKRR